MTEPAQLDITRTAYDTVAADYAEQLSGALATMPLERAVLASFAELVLDAAVGPVADVGCGPGRIAAHLSGLGVPVFGIDLSPRMVAEARRRHPELRFEVGSFTALSLPDASVGGVLAWYSLIHIADEELPGVVAELDRVLAPGGFLLTAFQVGDERVHREQAYGHPVVFDAYRRPPELVAGVLTGAGLQLRATTVTEPEGQQQTPQAYLLAHKPRIA
jgi:ubiquinone/menaquinone biosynthesis C-methylase UbiE